MEKIKFLGVLLVLMSAQVGSAETLECLVDGSDDWFILYPEQRIYRSSKYDVYALMEGMTLATVSRQRLRFHRITQLNLLPQPDRIQRFEGECRYSETTLGSER
ncbi:MAG: hypothetical protein V7752_06110 [Halopseudomonas sp.]